MKLITGRTLPANQSQPSRVKQERAARTAAVHVRKLVHRFPATSHIAWNSGIRAPQLAAKVASDSGQIWEVLSFTPDHESTSF